MVAVHEVVYEADGSHMRGRLAVPPGDGPFPGVLVAHEANGLDEFQAGRAATLAEAGYAAFALDYHGEGRVYTDRESMEARLEEIGTDADRIRALGQAGLDVLLAESAVDRSRVAAIGFCFGATVALELARTGADLKAIVGFHPGINTLRPEDTPRIRGKVLMCIGADDPVVPPATLRAFEEEMAGAGVDWQVHLYGGVLHSFTHPRAASIGIPGLRYDAVAADRSWRAMLNLLDEVFGPAAGIAGG